MENNYLSRKQVYKLIDELKKCGTDKDCADKVNEKYLEISKKQDKELLTACEADRTSSACRAKITEAIEGADTLYSRENISLDMFGLERVDDICKRAAANCVNILTNHDFLNEVAAGYNSNDPDLQREATARLRSFLGSYAEGVPDDQLLNLSINMPAAMMGMIKAAKGNKISKQERADFAQKGAEAFGEGKSNLMPKQTSNSAPNYKVNMTQGEAISKLKGQGYTEMKTSTQGVTVLVKGDTVYRFYPSSTSGEVPSASVSSISGGGKDLGKYRFDK